MDTPQDVITPNMSTTVQRFVITKAKKKKKAMQNNSSSTPLTNIKQLYVTPNVITIIVTITSKAYLVVINSRL